MAGVQSSAGNELRYIYSIFRKLKLIGESGNITAIGLDVKTIPRKLFLKLIDERLTNLNRLGADLVTNLFKRLTKKNRDELDRNLPQAGMLWPEIDGYFHYSVYHIHDFVIEFDWYESDLEELTKSDESYIKSNLPQVSSFLTFKELLSKFNTENTAVSLIKQQASPILVEKISSPKSAKSIKSTKSTKSIKSALSQGRISSPGAKRRVRFADTNEASTSLLSPPATPVRNTDLRIGHSILALDLLIYSMNLFVQQVCDQLAEWATTTSGLKDSLKIVRESRRKLRTQHLSTISTQIKSSNDVFFSILDCLAELRNVYLTDYILNTLCSRDPERLLTLYKVPRVRTFNRRIQLDVERKLIAKLANQILQILFDLIIAEINLPPVELGVDTKSRRKEEVEKSRSNYLNFITSWFKADQVIFGYVNKSRRSVSSNSRLDVAETSLKTSTLATGGQFKSSSRILAQMDNLDELMQDMLSEIAVRIRSTVQLKFFTEILHVGLQHLFDLLSVQLQAQLDSARKRNLSEEGSESSERTAEEIQTLAGNIDLVAAKIRCLKFVHIISSSDKMIVGLGSVCGIQLNDELASTKLVEFTNRCTQQSRSSARV